MIPCLNANDNDAVVQDDEEYDATYDELTPPRGTPITPPRLMRNRQRRNAVTNLHDIETFRAIRTALFNNVA